MKKRILSLVMLVSLISVFPAHFSYSAPNPGQDNYAIKTEVKDVKYRYYPLGEISFFSREPESFKLVTTPPDGTQSARIIYSKPGERIIDYLFNMKGEASWLFNLDDRGLIKEDITTIDSIASEFNEKGQLVKYAIKGEIINPEDWRGYPIVVLTRNAFKYDNTGKIIAYNSDYNYEPQGPWYGVKIYKVKYGNGKIKEFIYGDGTYGYWEKWHVYNIIYNDFGEVISCYAKKSL